MEQSVLSLNGGSSSLKFALFRIDGDDEERILFGAVEAIGTASGRAWLRRSDSIISDQSGNFADHAAAIRAMFSTLQQQGVNNLSAAGHRIVHGGPKFTAPVLVDEQLKHELKDLVPFAPLHIPSQLAMI